MKKFFAILMTLALMLSLAVPAMAAGNYTLTLNGAQEGHTYTAYQIFAGDLSGSTLSNIVWGSGVTAEGQSALGNAATKAASITTTEQAAAFATEVAQYLGNAAGSVTIAEKATSGTISNLAAGYYLVKTTATSVTNDVYTYYIMKVVKDTAATIKADTPEIDKTVNDNDANIGDTVTFILTATMPSNLQGYETYKVVFHDTLSKGLTFGSITSVTVGDSTTDVKEHFTLNTSSPSADTTGETTFTLTCNDVLAQNVGATAGSTIVVKYTAIVDTDAVIGTEGNLNEVYLEYSNDPNWNGTTTEPTGETPEAEVKVYTWEIPVFKYTGSEANKTGLAGAGFTLYKDQACNQAVMVTKDTTVTDKNIYKVDPNSAISEIVTDDTGKFEIEGLEKGTYYLKETTTPAGYNTCANVTVVIGENGALTQDNKPTTEVGILNQAGATLPETGGMGTTIFYAVGGVMVVAAVVLLVTKKRMSAEG